MLKQGQRVSIRATGMDRRGDGIAMLDSGQEIHVPGLLADELAIVTIEHISRQTPVAHGRLYQIREPNSGRRRPPCRHQGRCNGCPLMIATVALQARLKRERLGRIFSIAVPDLVCQPGGEFGYRWSSKRVVGGERARIRLGSYGRGSHHVADMGACLVDHPDILRSVQEIERAAAKLGIEPYDEKQTTGDLRYVWLKTDGAGQVLVTLITAAETSRVQELAQVLEIPTGVAQSTQADSGNVIRGSNLTQLTGASALSLELCGQQVQIGPLGFLQPNPKVAALAYQQLVGDSRGALAFDLYAGAGITTALLGEHYERVVPCDADEESAQGLAMPPRDSEHLLASVLDDPDAQVPELIVANPPRAGLGEGVCTQLNRLASERGGPQRLRIMSCHPAAMARDLKRLTGKDGAFKLVGIRAYDTLPNTAHVELVLWLDKK
jgi:23S rRNA (uracil1939-C5)-methyltransferase